MVHTTSRDDSDDTDNSGLATKIDSGMDDRELGELEDATQRYLKYIKEDEEADEIIRRLKSPPRRPDEMEAGYYYCPYIPLMNPP